MIVVWKWDKEPDWTCVIKYDDLYYELVNLVMGSYWHFPLCSKEPYMLVSCIVLNNILLMSLSVLLTMVTLGICSFS